MLNKFLLNNKKGNGCLAGLIVAGVIIAVLAVGTVVLLNQTPDSLGIADTEMTDGLTMRELGLADVKIKEVFSLLKALKNPDTSKIVTNSYNEETEKNNAEQNLQNSNIPTDTSGNVQYSSALTSPVFYDKEYLISYSDTTLAYIFNSMIGEGVDISTSSEDEGLAFIQKINAKIEEITISKDSTCSLRIVLSVDISDFKTEIESSLGAAAQFITIPDVVYLVSYSSITADENGYIVPVSDSIKINDTENALADAIFKLLAKKASDTTDGQTEGSDEGTINELVGQGFATVIKHLGRVGTAETSADGAVSGPKTLGSVGLSSHKISVITNTESNYENTLDE